MHSIATLYNTFLLLLDHKLFIKNVIYVKCNGLIIFNELINILKISIIISNMKDSTRYKAHNQKFFGVLNNF